MTSGFILSKCLCLPFSLSHCFTHFLTLFPLLPSHHPPPYLLPSLPPSIHSYLASSLFTQIKLVRVSRVSLNKHTHVRTHILTHLRAHTNQN